MTVAGWIFLILVVTALCVKLAEGVRDAMGVDKWRDLWHVKR